MAPRKGKTQEPETIAGAVHEVLEKAHERQPGDDTESEKPKSKWRGWQHNDQAGVQELSYADKETGRYEMWFKFRDGKPPN